MNAEISDVVEISDPTRLHSAPLVSVLMLTFNHELYIGQALNSILEQITNFEYEIVIGDDCSADKTLSIVAQYQASHPEKIRIVTGKANIGVTKNVVRTYRACRGRYIFLLEGDDFWRDPCKMMNQVDVLMQNPDVVITYHSSIAYIDGAPTNLHVGARKDLSPLELRRGAPINTLTVAFRAIINDFPDEFYLAPIPDIFLWSLLGQHGRGMYISTIQSAYYRLHSQGYFSSQSSRAQAVMLGRTFTLMMLYYGRVGFIHEEAEFRRRVVPFLLRSGGARYWISEGARILLDRVCLLFMGGRS